MATVSALRGCDVIKCTCDFSTYSRTERCCRVEHAGYFSTHPCFCDIVDDTRPLPTYYWAQRRSLTIERRCEFSGKSDTNRDSDRGYSGNSLDERRCAIVRRRWHLDADSFTDPSCAVERDCELPADHRSHRCKPPGTVPVSYDFVQPGRRDRVKRCGQRDSTNATTNRHAERSERRDNIDTIIARLRQKLSKITGANLFQSESALTKLGGVLLRKRELATPLM